MTTQLSFFKEDTAQYHWDNAIAMLKEYEHYAIERDLRGYAVGYSGGKDSDLLVKIFRASGVKFFVFHNHTTIDAPETVYYIRHKFAELSDSGKLCYIFRPEGKINSFWKLCLHKGFLPSRLMRFCCSCLKEYKNVDLNGSVHSFGVRKAESRKRALYREDIELYNKADYSDKVKYRFDSGKDIDPLDAFVCSIENYSHFTVNPCANMSDSIVLQLLDGDRISPLYSQGFCRVGCIGCPMAGKHRIEEFNRYPKFRDAYIRLCDKLIEKRLAAGRPNKYNFKCGQDYFDWWLYEPTAIDVMEGQFEMM